MKLRFDRVAALRSWVFPAIVYSSIVILLIYFLYPQFYLLRHEVIIALSFFALWRYGWMFLNYIRALVYAYVYYPRIKKSIEKIPPQYRYPKQLYFMIPSYKEDFWVTVETFRSILSEISTIPSNVTIVVATATKEEDAVIQKMFDAHTLKQKVELIFQHQSQGKRIAMGHALRSIARHYNHHSEYDPNSVTIFMDGDSYMQEGFLKKLLPFFANDAKIGAVTTNEVAYINSKNSWYKDWFNLKFGQRHILFQSHSLSRKVMTLTGRLSAYRTSIVVEEPFISQVENDILISPVHGKFRFLMGDDKTTWFYLLKHGWDMLYLPDLLCISLESRDGKFLELSRSLPYRWFGNTLRNNTRALKLGPWRMGLYIWYAILDQRLIMWTSLVGVSSAILLSLSISFYYILFFIAWVILVRLFQLFVIALGGHKVSWRMPILIVYTQWIGALIKIKAFYNLSDQKWSKNGDEQKMDHNKDHIKSPLVSLLPKIMMATSMTLFVLVLLLSHNILSLPNFVQIDLPSIQAPGISTPLDASTVINTTDINQPKVIDLGKKGVSSTNKNNTQIINNIISSYKGDKELILLLPQGEIPLYHSIVINKSNITLKGVSPQKTKLISYLRSSDKAVIKVQGERLKRLGYIQQPIYKNQSSFVMLTKKEISPYLLVRQSNDSSFLKELGSKKWHKKYPYLRQEIVEVLDKDLNRHKIYTKKPILTEFQPPNSEVIALKMVENITLRDFSIKQIANNDDIKKYRFDYTNRFPDVMVDAISFEYAAKCHVDRVWLLDSGSHSVICDYSYALLLENLYVNGSWNKGKKGNGYVRIARTFYSVLRNSMIKNIRHVTLQWSSSGNHLYDLVLGVDINLHGGYAHDNQIDHIYFDVPKKHKWKPVTHCPKNARWAPPDGQNSVNYKTFKYEKGSRKLE